MTFLAFVIILLVRVTLATESDVWRPCGEIKRDLRIPCACALTVSGARKNVLSVRVNCDRVALNGDLIPRLNDSTIVAFSQKFAGHRGLPVAVTSALPGTLESLDFSDNSIRRLADRHLRGHPNLTELRLANNALGDNVNPIFSSNEFHELSSLKLLDLRSNGLRGIEEGIFAGCPSLEELYLDFNNLTRPPVGSLKGPKALKVLGLAGNRIDSIDYGAFSIFGETLLSLNLSSNEINWLKDGAFTEMTSLAVLDMSGNLIKNLNSDALKGAYNLRELDMSKNLFENFPTEALRHLKNLRILDMSHNSITELRRLHLEDLKNLQYLDLSRNKIAHLGSNTFADLTHLVRLDLAFNFLRTMDESSFGGLGKLNWLSHLDLSHNQLSEVDRTAALGNNSLLSLNLASNRLTRISADVFKHLVRLERLNISDNPLYGGFPPVFPRSLIELDATRTGLEVLPAVLLLNLASLERLYFAGNRLREIDEATFSHHSNLTLIDLSDNELATLSKGAFVGLPSLKNLLLHGNKFTNVSSQLLPALLEDRAGFANSRGVNISLSCDCGSKALWKRLRVFGSAIVCLSPVDGQSSSCASKDDVPITALETVNSNNSQDDSVDSTSTDPITPLEESSPSTSSEPAIVWSTTAPTFPDSKSNKSSYEHPPVSVSGIAGSADDFLIIGIILAVVLLVLIVAATICVYRIRRNSHVRAAAMASSMHDASMLRPASSNFGGGKLNHQDCVYVNSYNGSTLMRHHTSGSNATNATSASPVQMLPLVQPLPIIHSTPNSQSMYGYYDNVTPFYVISTDNKWD
ncbi:insulin-like growth factor-binding protein complex acid labile subunit [Copidosoma floridanum]|uniref:insulin-like growth factor-binding protein complex acid labile subunit n=1 Tax=Copidosoma floridanum TaxID=29053 RepID=UPI0006C95BA7|nr:insulin-like growth factor-binding protein complex acid labile subunit [Copidosoma floridanum]